MSKNVTSKKKNRWGFYKKRTDNGCVGIETMYDFDMKELLEKREINLKPRVSVHKCSRLSPSLSDILKRSVALGYFLDYLNEEGNRNLLDFWLEAETFRMVLESNYKRKSHTDLKTGSSHKRSASLDSPSTPVIHPKSNNNTIHNCASSDLSIKNHPTTYEEFRQRSRTRSCIIDAVSIYTKYISLNADNPIFLPNKQRQEIEATVCQEKHFVETTCFVGAQNFAFEQLLSCYEEFISTPNMISYQLHYLNERKIKLQDVLYNETILFYFTEFVDRHQRRSVLEFHLAAENFEQNISTSLECKTYDKNQSVDDAMRIYERYFSMRCGENQLISDDKLRIVLENNICREDGPQANCFCIPMAYAWTSLSEVYLPAFLESEHFTQYREHLEKLTSRVDDTQSCCSSRSSTTEDSSSCLPMYMNLNGFGSKNNLLVEDESEFFTKNPHKPAQYGSRLALGHVDNFGVFNSEIPTTSDRKVRSVSKFGSAMKNLLRGETKQETEQLAWEKAKQIIEDVQRQTQMQHSYRDFPI